MSALLTLEEALQASGEDCPTSVTQLVARGQQLRGFSEAVVTNILGGLEVRHYHIDPTWPWTT